jgi:hypothetical protein
MRTSRLLLGTGLGIGSAIALLGLTLPNAGLRWFFHVPTSRIGLPLSLALLGAGAVVRRLERDEAATALRDAALDRNFDRFFDEAAPATISAVSDRDRAL